MSDAIAEFLKRGGAITSCPTAAVAEGSGVVPGTDRQELAEHKEQRRASVIFRWGHRKEKPREAGEWRLNENE